MAELTLKPSILEHIEPNSYKSEELSCLYLVFTQQWSIFASSLQPVNPYLVNELLNEGYLGHKRLYYGDTGLNYLCLFNLMIIRHVILIERKINVFKPMTGCCCSVFR